LQIADDASPPHLHFAGFRKFGTLDPQSAISPYSSLLKPFEKLLSTRGQVRFQRTHFADSALVTYRPAEASLQKRFN
jgi:hypothetical protein